MPSGTAPRTVKHFSLHRINNVELRTIADVDDGVIQLMLHEENVIRGYARAGMWPHHRVMLFVLQDLQPLMRQVQDRPGMTRERIAAIQDQPATVLYDLKALDECSVYVNQQASVKAGYWNDLPAMEGLLAHEHAHPIAENDTVRASRMLQLGVVPSASAFNAVLTALCQKLSLLAPREVFANEKALHGGFQPALAHLNQRLISEAASGLPGRTALVQRINNAVASGHHPAHDAAALLLAGDYELCLPLAIEVAPFYRCGMTTQAAQLESILRATLFAALGTAIEHTYTALRDAYVHLPSTYTPAELIKWCSGVMQILVNSFATVGYALEFTLREQVEEPTEVASTATQADEEKSDEYSREDGNDTR